MKTIILQMSMQKLRGLQLNRHNFQDLFEPVRTTAQAAKRGSETCGESSVGSKPAKQMRMCDQHKRGETNSTPGSGFSGNQSAFTSDDNVVGTDGNRDFDLWGSSASKLLADLASSANLCSEGKLLGENIVSSSGMEADSGVDTWSVNRGDSREAPYLGSSPQAAMQATRKMEGEEAVVSIKQEVMWPEDCCNHTGKLTGGDDDPSKEVQGQHVIHIPSEVDVCIKMEIDPERQELGQTVPSGIFPDHTQQNVGVMSCQVQPSTSPPLSCIRVENLQRQFEESVRSIDMFKYHEQDASSLSPSQHKRTKPSPTESHCQRQNSLVSSFNHMHSDSKEVSVSNQSAVENFLLVKPSGKSMRDPSQNSSQCMTNVLRRLLTKAQYSDKESSLNDDSGRYLQDRTTNQSSEDQTTKTAICRPVTSDSPAKSACDVEESRILIKCASASQASSVQRSPPDRFAYNLLSSLLTADRCGVPEDVCPIDAKSVSVYQSQEPQKIESMKTFKQEPDTASSEYNQALPDYTKDQQQQRADCDSGNKWSAATSRQDFTSVASHENIFVTSHLQSCAPYLRVRDILKLPASHTPLLPSLLLASESSRSCPEQPKQSRLLSLALSTPLASAQKRIDSFKSYSNMSLRDILTMRVPPSLELGGAASASSKDDHENKDVGEEDEEKVGGESQVVWECDFCDFSGAEKSVVASHRASQHNDFVDGSCEAEKGSAPWQRSPFSSVPETQTGLPQTGNLLDEDEDGNEENPNRKIFSPSRHCVNKRKLKRESLSTPKTEDSESEMDDSTGGRKSLLASSSEPDDPGDGNYIPPKSLQQSDSYDSESFSDTDAEQDSFSPRRKEAKNGGESRLTLFSKTMDKRLEDGVMSLKSEHTAFQFVCLYCALKVSSLKLIKDHIRCNTTTVPHYFKAKTQQASDQECHMVFLCPREECSFTSPNPKFFLQHVLKCQGHIFGACSFVLKVLTTPLCVSFRKASAAQCVVASCYFSSSDLMVMRRHLFGHILQMHAMLMVFMRTITSAVTDSHAGSSDLCPFLCFLCSENLSTLQSACVHMESEHGGLTTGVFYLQNQPDVICGSDARPAVSLCCTKCKQMMLQLGQWLCHMCEITASAADIKDSKHETHLSTMLWSRLLQPAAYDTASDADVNVMSLQLNEWPWYIKSSTDVLAARIPKPDSRTAEQVPLIRRILTENALLSLPVFPSACVKSQVQSDCSESLDSLNVSQTKVMTRVPAPFTNSDEADQRSGVFEKSSFPSKAGNTQKKSHNQNSAFERCSFSLLRSQLQGVTATPPLIHMCENKISDKDCSYFNKAVKWAKDRGTPGESSVSRAFFSLGASSEKKKSFTTSNSIPITSDVACCETVVEQQYTDASDIDHRVQPDDITQSSSSQKDSKLDLMNGVWACGPLLRSSLTNPIADNTSKRHCHSLGTSTLEAAAAERRDHFQTKDDGQSQVDQSSATPSHHASQLSTPLAKSCHCSQPLCQSELCDPLIAGKETEDMVAWLDQQGSHMMRVLGDAMDDSSNEKQF